MARRASLVLVVLVVILAGAAIYRVETRTAQSTTAAATQPESANSAAASSPTDIAKEPAIELKRTTTEAAHRDNDVPDANSERPEGPLRAGEVLEYSATVAKLSNVANLKLRIADRQSFLGKAAWHLQAFAHTENPLRMMFALDDQFDSYTDAASFSSLQYEMHLNERGQRVDSIQRMTVTGKEPATGGASQTRVLPGTRDPLGMMQYLRTIDWSKTPEVRGPVYDGHKLYEAHATVQGTEDISVPAGSYRASKIAIRVFDNGAELKDASFALYLAQNDVRTPVLLEAVMPFANARVELTKARTGE
jgi:hypothetical protein